MSASSPGRVSRSTLALSVVFAAIVVAAVTPHVRRLRHPTIYGDDVPRIFLQRETLTLTEALTTPFNEHIAPAFDAVTRLAWLAARGRLTAIAPAFTIAAMVPFGLVIATLAIFARRELGSWPSSAVVVTAFAAAPIHVVETVWWYSGSNHMWALFWTMVALLGSRRGGVWGSLAAATGSALAPACSLMGVLSAPACATYALAGRGRARRPVAAAAMAGLVAYCVFGASLGLVQALIFGRRSTSDHRLGLLVAGEAPVAVLLPALAGLRALDRIIPAAWSFGTMGALTLAALAWAWRGRDRAVIAVGLLLIVGAYFLIFPFRTAEGRELMLRTARYHLFPQLGLALLLGAATRTLLAGPRGGWAAAIGCAMMVAIQVPQMHSEVGFYDYPNQARTLAALERVRTICRAEGITDRQAVAALEPIRPHWMPFAIPGANAARLIGPIGTTHPVPDTEVRGRLLAALDADDREGLFGRMDVGPYLVLADDLYRKDRVVAVGHLIGEHRVKPSGTDHGWITEGWPSYLEYGVDAAPDEVASARSLVLPIDVQGGDVEVWWDDGRGRWSEGRSVLWGLGRNRPRGHIWAVRLDRMPHWDGHHVRRIRVAFRSAGKAFVQPPRLTRPD